MSKFSRSDIIEETIAFWGKRTEKRLSHEDAREILGNIYGFFQILAEWDCNTTEGKKAKLEGSK